MFNVFGWLRSAAKNAVLGGIADAVQEIDQGGAAPDLDRLRAVLASAETKQLPAPAVAGEEPEPAKGKGKVK